MIRLIIFFSFYIFAIQTQTNVDIFKDVEYISIYFQSLYDNLQNHKNSYINLIYKKPFFFNSELNSIMIFEIFLNKDQKFFIGIKISGNENKIVKEFLSTSNLKKLEQYFEIKIEKKTNLKYSNLVSNFLKKSFFSKHIENKNNFKNTVSNEKLKILNYIEIPKNNRRKYLDESIIQKYLNEKKLKNSLTKNTNKNINQVKPIINNVNYDKINSKNVSLYKKSKYANDYLTTLNNILQQREEIKKKREEIKKKKQEIKKEREEIENKNKKNYIKKNKEKISNIKKEEEKVDENETIFPRIKINKEELFLDKKKKSKKKNNVFIDNITFLPSLNEINYNIFSIHKEINEKIDKVFN